MRGFKREGLSVKDILLSERDDRVTGKGKGHASCT
jgi:hypothetical protein